MRTFLLAALAGTSIFASTIAIADDAKPVSPTPVATTNDADKPICKPVTHQGRVLGEACHTQKEWDRIQYRDQQELHQYQMQSLYQPR